ncbi:MAG: hypothetical protein F6K58_26305 [Symploca sp. SIO2E9]|nr:hypothetical protein [Symploca sp. SIO2E9]
MAKVRLNAAIIRTLLIKQSHLRHHSFHSLFRHPQPLRRKPITQEIKPLANASIKDAVTRGHGDTGTRGHGDTGTGRKIGSGFDPY